jgi:hypothetical protein
VEHLHAFPPVLFLGVETFSHCLHRRAPETPEAKTYDTPHGVFSPLTAMGAVPCSLPKSETFYQSKPQRTDRHDYQHQ